MKKRTGPLSVLLACALLGTMPATTQVFAADTTATQTQISKDDAIRLARTLVDLPEADWQLESVDANTGQGAYNYGYNRPTWNLRFQSTAKDRFAGAMVTLDATTGQLMYCNRFDKTTPQPGNLTSDQAHAIAEAFLKKVAATQFQQAVEHDNQANEANGPYGEYSFHYDRVVNGAVVLGNSINVMVSTNGTINNFDLRWNDQAQFPTTDSIIDAASAEQTYADSLDLRLQYTQDYAAGKLGMRLVYNSSYLSDVSVKNQQAFPYPIIDAKSGKLINNSAEPITTFNRPEPQILVPGGPTEPPKATDPLSQSDAEGIITSLGLIPSGATLVNSTYNEMEMKSWSFSYQVPTADPANPEQYNITLDALTGEVINYNAWSMNGTGNNQPSYTDDQLRNKAIDFVKTVFKDRTGALYAPDSPDSNMGKMPGTLRDFSFRLLKDGIPLPESITVSYDASTGQVINAFGLQNELTSGVPVTFPTPDPVVTTDQAKATYLKNRPLQLSYLFPQAADGTLSTTPILVYTPSQSQSAFNTFVDAKTGEWFSPDANKQKPPVMPTDIKGHWAEKSLQHYAQLGLLELVDGKADPDQSMTRATFVRLLVDAHGGAYFSGTKPTFTDVPTDAKYYAEIETASLRGWIAKDGNFRPNDPITREEAAAIFARVAGYKTLAAHKEIFHLPYTDANQISGWAYGSVAIDYGLGIMQGAGNEFSPSSTITLAQEVTALDKLNALQGAYPGM